MSFSDPIDGTNAGPGRSTDGTTDGSTGGTGTGGGTGSGMSGSPAAAPADTGTAGSTGTGTGGYGGSTGGTSGGDAGGYGGSTGAGTSSTSTGGLVGSTGGRTDTGTGGSAGTGATTSDAGGLVGSGGRSDGTLDAGTGGTGADGFPAATDSGEVGGVGDDFDLHEPAYRRHYTTVGTETAGGTGTYDEARTGYAAGHAAASNPAYADRTYEEVEVDLERNVGAERFGRVREFARHAFEWKRVLAGVALVAGGYWASRKLFSAAGELAEEDEQDCRTYYETHPVRSTGVPYSQARTVYVLGYVAGRNPEYAGRAYEDVEPHLRAGFTGRRAGSYDTLREFGRRGYERSSTRGTV